MLLKQLKLNLTEILKRQSPTTVSFVNYALDELKKVVFPNSCLLDYIFGQRNDNYKTECARFVAFHYGYTATEGHCR